MSSLGESGKNFINNLACVITKPEGSSPEDFNLDRLYLALCCLSRGIYKWLYIVSLTLQDWRIPTCDRCDNVRPSLDNYFLLMLQN